MTIIRVFPRRTSMTPTDEFSFAGDPVMFEPPEGEEVHISCVFTWDKPEAERLQRSWSRFYKRVLVGGPAYDDPGSDFEPGLYVRHGVVVTSRGCHRSCGFCFVPTREGEIRTLPIHHGNNVIDNNLLACPKFHVEQVFEMLEGQRRIIFSGGLDARLLERWHCDWFKKNHKHIKELWFGGDTQESIEQLRIKSDMLEDFGRKKRRVYVLIGYPGDTLEAARKRLEAVWNLGFMPFAQFYRGPGEQHKSPDWEHLQRDYTRPALMYSAHGGGW